MPRKAGAKPGPKSKQRQSESTKNLKYFLGDGSTAEESSADNESFQSADLDDQTDYGLDFTTSRANSSGTNSRASTVSPPSTRVQGESPGVSLRARERISESHTSPTKRRRKQKNPEQRDRTFWNNVRKLQMRTDNLVPKASFARVIREILTKESTTANRLTFTALVALQEAAEIYLTSMFQDAYCCTLHRGRVTLNVKDIELTRFLRGRNDPGNR